MEKFENVVDYKQLTDEQKYELKKEMFGIFCEMKNNDYAVKPKDIAEEVLKRFNVLITPQTVNAISKHEKWDKKYMVSVGAGVIDKVNESVFDSNKGKIDLKAYERELLTTVKIFMGKRFEQLQKLADESYKQIFEHPVGSKERWKAESSFFNAHDRQMKMIEAIGIDKIFEEIAKDSGGGIDMNRIIELWEIAEQNAKIIKDHIDKEEGKLIVAEVEDND